MHPTATQKATYSILIVDDDDTIREGIVGYLSQFHEADYALAVTAAVDVDEAKALLAQHTYDLVISDINMPGGSGFDVLDAVAENHPNTRSALITAYKVEDYMRLAKERGVFNIIAKTAPFNFEELSSVVNSLLMPENAFGLANYVAVGTPLQQLIIKDSAGIMTAFNTLRGFLAESGVGQVDTFCTALIEAMTNAVYHVAKNPDGTLKYKKGQQIEALAEAEWVTIDYGKDDERVGIAINDQGGRITADEILYWLERNISGAGLLDSHGRGVYLMHSLVDRLIININPGERTEIIVLKYFNESFSSNKPLFINQV